MLILFLTLTGLSLAALIAGIIWTLNTSGETRRRSGPEVGAELMAKRMSRDRKSRIVAQHAFFKGKATQVQSAASFSFAEIKQGVIEGQWRQVLPVLLAIGGFLGLFLFGSQCLWLIVQNRLIGGVILVVALYAIIRTLLAFVRA